MGLFDDLFGDDDAEQRARQEARRAQQERKKAKRRFEADLSSAEALAMEDAISYFEDLGLDPQQYMPEIQRAINQTRLNVPHLSGNVGSYFDDLGENVYSDLSNREQLRAGSALENMYSDAPGSRITDTLDDSVIEEILAESRQGADQYLQNLMDRGVITQSGFDAGARDLEAQGQRARGTLGELGSTILSGGRERLNDIFDEGRHAASNLRLGQTFDPNTYKGRIDSAFEDFMNNLGSKFRSQVPGNLFETSGLAARAGAAMGPQNTAFAPNALAGIFEEDEDEEDNPYGQIF